MQSTDHYATLGVLPDAEPVVITAAYRALVQRYHPDKWSGDAKFAHERTAAINEAYRVLGDATRRAEYDRQRATSQRGDYHEAQTDEPNAAFNEALSEQEERWRLACSIYPDLAQHRERLAKISVPLAFAFVVGLLEHKTFTKRAQIAAHLETSYLSRYFGTNDRILDYARTLVLAGERDAALALNELVDVMGSAVEPDLLIRNIDERFGRAERKRKADEELRRRQEEGARTSRLDALRDAVRRLQDTDAAWQLARLSGYLVTHETKGFFPIRAIYHVSNGHGEQHRFEGAEAFRNWVLETLCA